MLNVVILHNGIRFINMIIILKLYLLLKYNLILFLMISILVGSIKEEDMGFHRDNLLEYQDGKELLINIVIDLSIFLLELCHQID